MSDSHGSPLLLRYYRKATDDFCPSGVGSDVSWGKHCSTHQRRLLEEFQYQVLVQRSLCSSPHSKVRRCCKLNPNCARSGPGGVSFAAGSEAAQRKKRYMISKIARARHLAGPEGGS